MTEIQLYVLVAIPLIGILAGTGLFLHLSSRIGRVARSLHADMRELNKSMTALRLDVALLKDKVGL